MDPRRMRFVYLFLSHQDYCGPERHNGSFSIITENVPCGTTGVTCSKSIKVFLGRTELKLEDKQKVVITRDLGNHVKYWTRTIGLYLVVEASNGVMLIWDKKTTMFVKLTPNYKGKVCGLCGNFDDKANNDFTTRSQVQANNALDFGNSWKRDSKCPDVDADIEPCDQKLHRKSWAEKECSLIKSEVFAVCHPKVSVVPCCYPLFCYSTLLSHDTYKPFAKWCQKKKVKTLQHIPEEVSHTYICRE
ncbi:UNVERIFIED_CONTAM: Mucin-2 [Gekko kuhli]